MTSGESMFLDVRGLRCHLRCWGRADAPLVVLLHGWMDASASFRFLVEALGGGFRCVAPDWRGCGRSQWAPDGVYTYPDYLADLDAIMATVAPGRPAAFVGHSLGGNIASLYAATRPERVRCVANIEGFGLRTRRAAEAPAHLRRWLDELAALAARRVYPNLEAVAARVREASSRITAERALFVAHHWAERTDAGDFRLRADPAHRRVSPHLFRLDEALACWRAIEAPVLWIETAHSENIARHHLTRATLARRRGALRNVAVVRIEDAGHMVHWERPEALAAAMRPFLDAHTGESSIATVAEDTTCNRK